MKGIRLCGECADYDKKKHRCRRGANMEENPQNPFYDDCPLPNVTHMVRGKWLHTEEPLGWQAVDCMECSVCHDSWIIEEDHSFDDMPLWNYCPSCGARMDGKEA